jgi:DNA-binding beta-propeller fold protein YncE
VDLAGTWTKQSMFSMALTADGRLLYVVDAGNGSLTAINGDTHQVWRRATFAGRPGDADGRAASAAVSPDGARLYATAAKGIAVIQTSDLTLKQWLANGLAARSLAVSGDGRRLFALSGDAVHAIDTATGAATRLATVGDGARAVHLLSLP